MSRLSIAAGVVALGGFAALGCGGGNSLAGLCDECPAGEMCGIDNECHPLCDDQQDCDACSDCFDGICYPLTVAECRARTCSAESCAEGCCQNGACQTATAMTCGISGAACVDCTAEPRADSCSTQGECVCAATGELCPTGEYCQSSGCSAECTPQCVGKCDGSDGCGGTCPDVCVGRETCGGGGVANVCGEPADKSPCTLPWGGTIASDQNVTAYAASSVVCNNTCNSETRTCIDGTLSGSFHYASCSVQACASCDLPWGGSITHGQSVTAYDSSSVACGGTCTSQTRTCHDGTLLGSFHYASCSVQVCCTQSGVSPELAALAGGPYQNCQVPVYPTTTYQENTIVWSGCCGTLVRVCAVEGFSTSNVMYCQ